MKAETVKGIKGVQAFYSNSTWKQRILNMKDSLGRMRDKVTKLTQEIPPNKLASSRKLEMLEMADLLIRLEAKLDDLISLG